jgi:hypothetical protein
LAQIEISHFLQGATKEETTFNTNDSSNSPRGEDFIASTFLTEHPEYKWQEPYLKDMKSNPWTLFAAKRIGTGE